MTRSPPQSFRVRVNKQQLSAGRPRNRTMTTQWVLTPVSRRLISCRRTAARARTLSRQRASPKVPNQTDTTLSCTANYANATAAFDVIWPRWCGSLTRTRPATWEPSARDSFAASSKCKKCLPRLGALRTSSSSLRTKWTLCATAVSFPR